MNYFLYIGYIKISLVFFKKYSYINPITESRVMQRKKYYIPKKREFKNSKSKYNIVISIADDSGNELKFEFSLIQESESMIEFSEQLEKLINRYCKHRIKTFLVNVKQFNKYSMYLQKCIDLEKLVYDTVFKIRDEGFQKIAMY